MIHLDLDLELRRRREYLFLRCILLRLLCRPCRPCRCRRLVLLLFTPYSPPLKRSSVLASKYGFKAAIP